MARSLSNANKNHLASIKCKKTLGGRGSAPETQLEDLTALRRIP